MKELINNNIKLFIGILIGGILFSGITYVMATSNIASSGVEYLTSQNVNVENIEDALDELYNKTSKSIYLSNFITTGGQILNGSIYYHNPSLQYSTNDESIRYSGSNPNNYVCFGSDANICPDTNLYRIIGLIPVDVVVDATTNPVKTARQVLYKIIKNDYLTSAEVSTGVGTYNSNWHPSTYNGPSGNQYVSDPQGYYWSGSSSNRSNTWSISTLNTSGLNGEFLTNLGSTWTNKIATVMWKVGGGNWADIGEATPMSTVYTNEITESGQNVTNASTDGKNEYAAKVGLMYVSDYGYAAPNSAWTTPGYNSSGVDYRQASITSINWLYRGVYEWTITRTADGTNSVHNVRFDGYINDSYMYSNAFGVRPVFYLTKDSVMDMTNHAGNKTDPYRIS